MITLLNALAGSIFIDSEIYNRSLQSIAQGALTNSKRASTFIKGVYPTHLTHGDGPFVWDTKGNKYVDFICGLGSNILGYNNEEVNEAIIARLKKGITLSLATDLEVQVAEQVKGYFPWIERVKFFKTGTEACHAAIRIARANRGIRNGGQEMHEMLTDQANSGVSQKRGFSQEPLSDVHKGLSVPASCERNQANSSETIQQNIKGQRDRTETFSEAANQNKISRERPGLLYGPEEVDQTAMRTMWEKGPGSSPGLHGPIERGLAVPAASRGYPSNGLVLSDGYHGHSEEFVSLTQPASGCFYNGHIQPLQGTGHVLDEAPSAVIIEPVICDYSPNRRAYLNELIKISSDKKSILIFDEIITGFRFPRMSVSSFWGIKPDIICLGKGIANGMPLSVVGGPASLMDHPDYFTSGTFCGETLSLAAASRTMTLLQTRYNLQDLWERGNVFLSTFNTFWPEKLSIEGYPTRGRFIGCPVTKALFWQESVRAGILFGPSFFFNFAHASNSNLIDGVLNTCAAILTRIRTGQVKLQGELPSAPFSERVRQ